MESVDSLSFSSCGNQMNLVYSIYILAEDNQIFVCEWKQDYYTVTEYGNSGDVVSCCQLIKDGKSLFPDDITAISSKVLVVACAWNKRLCYLHRDENKNSLVVNNLVPTEKQYCSLSFSGTNIYACDKYHSIDLLSKEGKKLRCYRNQDLDWLRIILTVFGFPVPFKFSYTHRIRVDISKRCIWTLNKTKNCILCFSYEGYLIGSFEGVQNELIQDISVTANGQLYYCTRNGVFLLSPQRQVHRFKKPSECDPRIYFLGNKIFISAKFEGELQINSIENIWK